MRRIINKIGVKPKPLKKITKEIIFNKDSEGKQTIIMNPFYSVKNDRSRYQKEDLGEGVSQTEK
jgi:hypothetical protein